MTTTAQEATRDELIAEYVARDAVSLVLNRVTGVLCGEDEDVMARMDNRSESLVVDDRLDELFRQLWPNEDDDESPDYRHASAEACYLAGRILRTIVYHSEHLRGDVQGLFKLAEKHRWATEEAGEAESRGADA